MSAVTLLFLGDADHSSNLDEIDLSDLTGLTNLSLENCGLSAASVNGVLATLVANGLTNGSAQLAGTNAAPTGQGLTDKTTLISRGWTVTTN